MRRNWKRFPAALAVVALIASGCLRSGSPAATSPGAGGTQAASATPAGPPVEIRWYCCLGGGDATEQVKVEKEVAAAFTASHPNIKLTFEVVPYAGARDTLATQIASGKGPDIVGPLGIGGANAFPNQWLDLAPLIKKYNYDLSQFPANTVEIYQLGSEGQVGIPFAIYPSALFYKKEHFREAGLNEPPHKYGDKYKMPDGTEVEWNYDTVRQIAMKLTVDKAGKDATQAGFNPRQIVQFGFEPQRDDPRQVGAYWGAGRLVSDDGKTAQIPDAWKAGWKWWYQGMWKDHFSMTGPIYQSDEFNPSDYPFFTGRVSMSQNYLWSTYGLDQKKTGKDWDLAASPSYQGKATAAFNADTFRIMKSSKHPDEAFQVLTYLLGEASGKLLQTYGGLPARAGEQAAFFETKNKNYPGQTIDWQVAIDGIEHADNPNFESPMPNYNKALDLLNTFGTRWQAKGDLNLDTEIDNLQKQLQAIFNQSG